MIKKTDLAAFLFEFHLCCAPAAVPREPAEPPPVACELPRETCDFSPESAPLIAGL
jgi:hypothetical protein